MLKRKLLVLVLFFMPVLGMRQGLQSSKKPSKEAQAKIAQEHIKREQQKEHDTMRGSKSKVTRGKSDDIRRNTILRTHQEGLEQRGDKKPEKK